VAEFSAVWAYIPIKGTIPLPGGETAIYNGSGLNYIRHKDWLGSSRLATTWAHGIYSKEAYAPFGETYNEAGTPDRSFTGQDQDTTPAVYDYLFRKYDPVAGRWLSPDPAGWSAVDLSNPQSLNRYAYVQNNPMASVDPKGLDDCYPVTDGTDSPTGETVCVPTYDASNNTPPYGANYLNENPTVYDQEDELDALEAMGLMAQLNSGDPAAAAQALQIMEDNGWIWPPIDTTGGDSGDNSGSDSCGTPSNSSSSDANFTAALKRSGFRAMDGTSTSGTNSCKAANTATTIKVWAVNLAAVAYVSIVPKCDQVMKQGAAAGVAGASIGLWGLLSGPLAPEVETGGAVLRYGGTIEAGLGKLGIGCRQ